MKSINQMAQEDGDTTRNEAARIKAREAAVAKAWRTYVWEHDENPTAQQVSQLATEIAEELLGVEYVTRVCGTRGYELK